MGLLVQLTAVLVACFALPLYCQTNGEAQNPTPLQTTPPLASLSNIPPPTTAPPSGVVSNTTPPKPTIGGNSNGLESAGQAVPATLTAVTLGATSRPVAIEVTNKPLGQIDVDQQNLGAFYDQASVVLSNLLGTTITRSDYEVGVSETVALGEFERVSIESHRAELPNPSQRAPSGTAGKAQRGSNIDSPTPGAVSTGALLSTVVWKANSTACTRAQA